MFSSLLLISKCLLVCYWKYPCYISKNLGNEDENLKNELRRGQSGESKFWCGFSYFHTYVKESKFLRKKIYDSEP